MNAFVSRGLITLAVAGGIIAFGAGAAQADDGTDGDGGLLSGLQGVIDATVPVHVGGNSISVIGDSSSSGSTSSGSSSGSGAGSGASSASTSGTDSVLGGTQGVLGIDIPAVVSGNAISVLGDSSSSGYSFAGSSGDGANGSDATTSGENSTLGGTQVLADAGIPVTLSGNAISVLGDSSTGSPTAAGMSGDGSSPSGSTTGENTLLGGTQVLGGASAPITVGGNAVSVLGDSSTGGGSSGGTGGDGGDPGQPGEVGGETTIPGATAGVSGAAVLAATGSSLQTWLVAMATLLLGAGATLTARVRSVR
ncbi:MAG TPA: hypothetical protein VL294_10990 [Pseudolysinimonas sp.]|jgi:hypothetical protein|nr:hypothetical protein [Pseudolysinimonas sp.]